MSEVMLGNKINCIIRAYTGTIGTYTMQYKYQPYTFLRDVEVTFSFSQDAKTFITGKSTQEISWNNSDLTSIRISNVPLTSRIINLIYKPIDQKVVAPLISHSEVLTSEKDGKLYLDGEKKYQVFLIDDADQCEKSYGELNTDFIQVKKPSSDYLLVYYKLINNSDSTFSFNSGNNTYVTLDFDWISNNQNNQSAKGHIHIERAAVKINNSISFNRFNNKVDLTFDVIEDEHNYISFEE